MIKMKDSGIEWIGQVPDDWDLERLQWHLYEIVEKNDPIQTTQVLSLTNKKGVIPYEEKGNQGNTAKENYTGYKIAYPNTIVANSMNVLIGSVGYSKLYGCVSPVYYVFKEKKHNDLRFINYIMQTPQFQRELRKCANGILEIRLRVSASDILKQKCAFPKIHIQTLIADYLDEKCAKIDAIIEKQNAVIEKLKEYKLSVITETVTKGLNPDVEMKDSGNEWIGKIPKHWECNKLKYLFLLHRGYDLSSENFKADKIPVIGSSGFMGFHNVATSSAPNVVIGRSGSTGKLHYVTEDFWAHNTGIYISNLKGNCAKYIYYLLHVVDMNELATKTAVPTLDRKKIQNYILSFTYDAKEQQQIVEYLDKKCITIDSVILKKQDVIIKLTDYKKSLIYEVVTGKKEV